MVPPGTDPFAKKALPTKNPERMPSEFFKSSMRGRVLLYRLETEQFVIGELSVLIRISSLIEESLHWHLLIGRMESANQHAILPKIHPSTLPCEEKIAFPLLIPPRNSP